MWRIEAERSSRKRDVQSITFLSGATTTLPVPLGTLLAVNTRPQPEKVLRDDSVQGGLLRRQPRRGAIERKLPQPPPLSLLPARDVASLPQLISIPGICNSSRPRSPGVFCCRKGGCRG
jgi:hypothetical protein